MAEGFPGDFHVVCMAGVSLHIDAPTRREVERWLGDADFGLTLDVMSLYGEDVTLIRDRVQTVYSTTAESRRRDREHARLLRDEVPVEERE